MPENLELIQSTLDEEKALSFTDLKEMTGLCNGVLQHHIHNSEGIVKKRGAVLQEGACEDCEFRSICEDSCIHKELNKESTGTVYKLLKEGLSQADIARRLDLSRATVHYHVEKLRDMDLLQGQNE